MPSIQIPPPDAQDKHLNTALARRKYVPAIPAGTPIEDDLPVTGDEAEDDT